MKTLVHISVLLAIASVGALVSAMVRPIRADVQLMDTPPPALARLQASLRVSLEEIEQWDEPVLWIDARASFEAYELDRVPGALYLVEPGWDELLPYVKEQYRPGMRVVVYCDGAGCLASDRVALRLREELGWTDVYVLHGGWDAWQASRQ